MESSSPSLRFLAQLRANLGLEVLKKFRVAITPQGYPLCFLQMDKHTDMLTIDGETVCEQCILHYWLQEQARLYCQKAPKLLFPSTGYVEDFDQEVYELGELILRSRTAQDPQLMTNFMGCLSVPDELKPDVAGALYLMHNEARQALHEPAMDVLCSYLDEFCQAQREGWKVLSSTHTKALLTVRCPSIPDLIKLNMDPETLKMLVLPLAASADLRYLLAVVNFEQRTLHVYDFSTQLEGPQHQTSFVKPLQEFLNKAFHKYRETIFRFKFMPCFQQAAQPDSGFLCYLQMLLLLGRPVD